MTIFIKKFIDTDDIIENVLEQVEELCDETADDLLIDSNFDTDDINYEKWRDALANEIYEKLAAKIVRNYKAG